MVKCDSFMMINTDNYQFNLIRHTTALKLICHCLHGHITSEPFLLIIQDKSWQRNVHIFWRLVVVKSKTASIESASIRVRDNIFHIVRMSDSLITV